MTRTGRIVGGALCPGKSEEETEGERGETGEIESPRTAIEQCADGTRWNTLPFLPVTRRQGDDTTERHESGALVVKVVQAEGNSHVHAGSEYGPGRMLGKTVVVRRGQQSELDEVSGSE